VLLTAYGNGDRILIDVKDHCGGLPAGAAENMFQPYFQGDADRTGIGLGLTIARQNVMASGGAVTTHDLPRVAGLCTGADLVEQREYDLGGEEELALGRDGLLVHLPGLPVDASSERAVQRAYELLAEAPSRLLSATLDDAVAAERRPNVPGTTERPNWSLPLPVPVEDLPGHPLVQRIADTLGGAVAG
jgi:4-alpha-glucanotransferase